MFRSIQVLRAVAALSVVFGHAFFVAKGGFGVDLFFVISGFIMASVAPGRTPREFVAARLWRVMPLYWINLAPWLAAAIFAGTATAARTVTSITLWPAWPSGTLEPYLQPGWTLSFEMVFYLAVAAALRWGWKWPAAIYAALLSVAWANPILGFLGNPLFLEFLAGVAIYHAPKRPRVGLAAMVGAIIMLATLDGQLVLGPNTVQGFVPSLARAGFGGFPAALLVYAALTFERLFAGRLFDGAVRLGDASYSLYLSHLAIVSHLPPLVGVAVAVLVALAMWRWVETPLRRTSWNLGARRLDPLADIEPSLLQSAPAASPIAGSNGRC